MCRKHGLECTSACGHCQDGNCDNMKNDPVIEDNEDDEDDVWKADPENLDKSPRFCYLL